MNELLWLLEMVFRLLRITHHMVIIFIGWNAHVADELILWQCVVEEKKAACVWSSLSRYNCFSVYSVERIESS